MPIFYNLFQALILGGDYNEVISKKVHVLE